MRAWTCLLALGALAFAGSSQAGALKLDGFFDLRVVNPSNTQSWETGGPGKLRFDGNGGQDLNAEIPQVAIQGRAQLTQDLSGVVLLRYAPDQKTAVDLIESYLRYRPVSTTPWRGSLKIGIFFPPISLENTELGWTSPWTLTPSAINSWVGEELRTLGSEVTIEHRLEKSTFQVEAALYGWNDPAGIMLADRGWALGDKPTGLFDRMRLPDAVSISRGASGPMHTLTYQEIDNRPGWYAGASWRIEDVVRIDVLRYDNSANAAALDRQFAWRTKFWSAGVSVPFGEFTLLTQAMHGQTIIGPIRTFKSVTDFDSAYALVGWTRGEVRLAARAEVFGTVERHPHQVHDEDDEDYPPDPELSEHGHAFTFAANWLPRPYLRLTAEVLHLYSYRAQREAVGLPPNLRETQMQFNLRTFF